jgi:uncharacterized protein (DUF1330 family)
MKHYVILEVEVFNHELYNKYKLLSPATLEKYGGRFLVRGGAYENIEGEWKPQRIVVLLFETKQKALDWWNSEEYAPAKDIRYKAAKSKMIVIEGVE